MDDTFEDSELGQLPAFSDAETKQLFNKILAMERQCKQDIDDQQHQQQRYDDMFAHDRNVQLEMHNSMQLIESRKLEIGKVEETVTKLSAEEKGTRKDMEALDADVEKANQRVSALTNSCFAAEKRFSELEEQAGLAQESYGQWSLVTKQKGDDAMAVMAYIGADATKVKETQAAIERSNRRKAALKAELDAEVSRTQTSQTVVERILQDMFAEEKQLATLAHEFEMVINGHQARDASITSIQGELEQTAAEVDARKRDFHSAEEQLRIEKKGESELAAEETARQKEWEAAHHDLEHAKTVANNMDSEMRVARNAIASIEKDMKLSQSKRGELDSQCLTIKAKTAAVKDEVQALRDGLADLLDKTKTEAERQAEARAMFEEAERLYEAARGERTSKEQTLTTERDVLTAQQGEQTKAENDISGAQSMLRNLASAVKARDIDNQKQQKKLYTVNYEVQRLERQLARAQGQRTKEETTVMNDKIANLTANLERRRETLKKIKAQETQLQQELVAARQAMEKVTREQAKKQQVKDALVLITDNLDRECSATLTRRNETMVRVDQRKVEVGKRTEQVEDGLNVMLQWDNKCTQAQLARAEKVLDVQALHDEITCHVRTIADENARLTREANEKQVTIGNLSSRLEVLRARMGVDEDGKPLKQAVIVVKAQQQRQELLDKINALEAECDKLRKRQAQLMAMHRDVVKARENIKASGAKAANSKQQQRIDELTLDIQGLEAKLRATMRSLHRLPNELSFHRELVQSLEDTITANQASLRRAEDELQLARGQHVQAMQNMAGEVSRAMVTRSAAFPEGDGDVVVRSVVNRQCEAALKSAEKGLRQLRKDGRIDDELFRQIMGRGPDDV